MLLPKIRWSSCCEFQEVARSHAALLSEMGAVFKAEGFDWNAIRPYGFCNKCMCSRKGGNATAGKILAHAKSLVTSLRESIGIRLCIFKIGVTANPLTRYSFYLENGYTCMWLIAVSHSIDLIHMLEAALISEFFRHVGCKNKPESGGEGALNRSSPPEPPYFAYVVGGRADQGHWVG